MRSSLDSGEMQIATRAVKLYEMFIKTSDDATIQIPVFTLFIASSILTERTAPDEKSASTFISVIVEC
jgi:hypothetical protein